VSISESHGRELDQTSAQHEQLPSAQDVVIVATSTLIDPQPWPQLADDAVNSSPSENTSPRSSLQYDGHGALFSPVAAAISPATEYSEWLPHPAEPGTCDTSDLVVYFSRHVAPLLLFDVDGSRDRVCALLVSLADEDAPITAAICAVSSAHMQRVSSRGELAATDYHSLALSRLATLIESGCGHELALATILLLISYELLAHGSSSDMIEHHLRGAYSTLLALRGASSELLRHLECVSSLQYRLRIPTLSVVCIISNSTATTFSSPCPLARIPWATPRPWAPHLRRCQLEGARTVRGSTLPGTCGRCCIGLPRCPA
jgi:hypothetical protein